MEQWLWFGIVFLLVVLFFVFFLYKRIALIFASFYHNKAAHLIVITKNNQSEIEWRIWSYFFWNRIIGKKGVVTVIDTGSNDDTLKILWRLASRYSRLFVVKLHPTVTIEEAIQQALEKHEHTKKDMIVLDLQEVESEKQEKHSA